MVEIKFRIYRLHKDDRDFDMKYHNIRKQIVKDLIQKYQLEVKNDEGWKKLNDTKNSSEWIEILFVLGTTGVFAAVLSELKHALDEKKLSIVQVKKPDNSANSYLEDVNANHLKDIVKKFFKKDETKENNKKNENEKGKGNEQ